MHNSLGLFRVVVRFTLVLVLVSFLVGTGVKAGLEQQARNELLNYPDYLELYENATRLGMEPSDYYLKYIAPKKHPELAAPTVVVGFNALISSLAPPKDEMWRKIEHRHFAISRREAFLRTFIFLLVSEIFLVLLSVVVAFWALRSQRVAGILSIFSRVISGIPVWWLGVVFILIIIYSALPDDILISPGPGAGLLTILRAMIFPVLTVVLISFWRLAMEFYMLLRREILSPYVSYKRAVGLPENRILRSVFKAISVPALSVWFSHLIEVEGMVIVVDYLFKLGGLGQMIASSFSGARAETFYFIPSLFTFPLLVFIVLNLIISISIEFIKPKLDPRGGRI
ncbi:ABC transporter permease family protein [Thermococcus pacificus]|uniref:ABC transmembrane type-1 domain-containing protein n=1 Tax=Thermococcus pacificus TaxID=71998 RepID=A0A218P5R4_9EURY|nr:hypothetical protein [Thermococcus pacificus]ASJ06128.1 hypothetical protein A3L08_01690 [Thermococcus pacificus]